MQRRTIYVVLFFFFRQKTAYEIAYRLVGSEIGIRDGIRDRNFAPTLFAKDREGLLGRPAPGAVLAVGEIVRNLGVGDENAEIVRVEGDRFRLL